jgi:hypothetical protein
VGEERALATRLLAMIEAFEAGRKPEHAQVERLLNDGCTLAHDLERRVLRLERRSQAAIDGHGDLDAFASIRREQRALKRQLDVLRARLTLLRAAARESQVP